MSEGIIDTFLGEEDRPDIESPELAALSDSVASADPFAVAITHQGAVYSPEVAGQVCQFMEAQSKHVALQSQLVSIQTQLIKDEHDLRLQHLRNQLSEENLRRLGLRLRVSFQIFLACVATAVGVIFCFMVHDAIMSRSVIIDPFEVSANISTEVPTGKIVATGLLDVLSKIQAATRTSAERRAISSAWTNDIAIDVAETGISIGQIERTLKARIGNDQHINGDVVRAENGQIALTVRGTGILAKTFTGPVNELDRLVNLAGEYVYGQSQPGLWANFLTNAGRNDEAIAFAQASYPIVATSEKPYVLNYWANAIVAKGGPTAMQQALPMYRETLRLKPDYWSGYNNVIYALWNMGREEASIRQGEKMIQMAGGRPGRALESLYQNYDQQLWDLPAVRKENIADMASHEGIGIFASFSGAASLQLAQTEALMHDVNSAQLRVQTTKIDNGYTPDVAIAALTRATIHEEMGNLVEAAKDWDIYATGYADPTVATSDAASICSAAVTYEKTGHSDKADAALDAPFKATGFKTFVDCYRFRGDVLDLRGDWAGAQTWYARAVELAPSIPSGYYSWGRALFKHGDLGGAIQQFKQATVKGPHWADPYKAWGDVLVKQGRPGEALEKYDQALKYAPKWQQLKDARELASKALG